MCMRSRFLHWMILAMIVIVLMSADRAGAMGEILGQTKEELKLAYEVTVQDHGTGRVTIVLTLSDEGRLEPLDAVELHIPSADPSPGGGRYADLSLSLDLKTSADGKRVARVHIRRDWAARAELWLTTSTFDGKQLALTRFHHIIPIAPHLKSAPAAAIPATQPAPAPVAPPAPPASPPATAR